MLAGYIFVIAEIIGAICMATTVFDMLMNGGRDASWAPWGLGLTVISGFVMWATWP